MKHALMRTIARLVPQIAFFFQSYQVHPMTVSQLSSLAHKPLHQSQISLAVRKTVPLLEHQTGAASASRLGVGEKHRTLEVYAGFDSVSCFYMLSTIRTRCHVLLS